jgi:hypothetical protein
LLVLSFVLLGACSKKAEAPVKEAPKTEASAPVKADTTAGPAAESANDAEDNEDAEKTIYGEPRNLDHAYDRETLEKAFVDIECTRQKNDPKALEAVFFKYGFQHPKLWTRAWAKANKDKEWVAKVVLKAKKACPEK